MTYFNVRCKAKLKDEFIPVIEEMIESPAEWYGLGYDFLEEYAKMRRSSFIPFGVLSGYAPSGWKDDSEWGYPCVKEGYFVFQCSLKDDDLIYYFFTNVLVRIAEYTEHLEIHNDEWESKPLDFAVNGSKYYRMKEGRIEQVRKELMAWDI